VPSDDFLHKDKSQSYSYVGFVGFVSFAFDALTNETLIAEDRTIAAKNNVDNLFIFIPNLFF